MTPCPPADSLAALLADALPAAAVADLESHVRDCPRCQAELDRLTDTGGEGLTPVAGLETAAVPSDLLRAVGAQGPWAAPRRPPDHADVLAVLAPSGDPGVLGRLGHFEVLEVVGRGGMGVVVKARDTKLRRVVAVKLMAPALAAVPAARRRFVREARAAAAIRDDHVVGIHAVEDSGPVPYLVMEFIAGPNLEDRIRTGPLDPRDVVRIGEEAARGLAAAHACGLIHRDVKPGNILIEGGTGRARLTDFGLVRVADGAEPTQTGQVVGTPAYMSPEQARGESLDARSDLYSLGCVLYAACTGRPPFGAGSPLAVMKRVADDEPPPLRAVRPETPEWLAGVVDRLMARNPSDRPPTAADAADTLSRGLAHLRQPDLVPPPAASRRPRAARRGTLALLVVFAFAVLVSVALVFRPGKEDSAAQGNPHSPDENRPPAVPVPTAAELSARPEPADALRRTAIPAIMLARAGRGDPAAAPPELVAVFGGDDRFRLPDVGTTSKAPPLTNWPAVSRDGALLAVPKGDAIVLFETETGRVRRVLFGHTGRVHAPAFSPDGRHIAAGNWDADNTVRVWEVATGKLVHTLTGHTQRLGKVAYSHDGSRIASTAYWDRTVRVWDAETGEPLRTLDGMANYVCAVAFSPDGRWVAGNGGDADVWVWDANTGVVERRLAGNRPGPATLTRAAVFSPDGRWLAAGSDADVVVWDTKTWAEKRRIAVPAAWLEFGPGGRTLFSGRHGCVGGYPHAASRIDVATGAVTPLPLAGRDGWPVYALHPDGTVLYAYRCSPVGHPAVLRFDASTGNELTDPPGHVGQVWSVAVRPDGARAVSAGEDHTIRGWDLATGAIVQTWYCGTAIRSVAFGPDGVVIAGDDAGGVRVYSPGAADPATTLTGPVEPVIAVAAVPGGVAAAFGDGSVTVWSLPTKQPRVATPGKGSAATASFGPGGGSVAVGGKDGVLRVCDVSTGRVAAEWRAEPESVRAVAFAPTGRTAATVGISRGTGAAARVWDIGTRTEVGRLGETGTTPANGVAWRPDGQLLAVCGGPEVRLMNVTGQPGPAIRHASPGPVAFTPQGRHLVAAGLDGSLAVFRLLKLGSGQTGD